MEMKCQECGNDSVFYLRTVRKEYSNCKIDGNGDSLENGVEWENITVESCYMECGECHTQVLGIRDLLKKLNRPTCNKCGSSSYVDLYVNENSEETVCSDCDSGFLTRLTESHEKSLMKERRTGYEDASKKMN